MTLTEPGTAIGAQPAGAGPGRRRRRRGGPAGPAAAPLVRGRQGRAGAVQRGRARVVQSLIDDGYDVFVDLKMADIPTTVQPGRPGAGRPRRVLPHACTPSPAPTSCGPVSQGCSRAPTRPAWSRPRALAVTVLTSDTGRPAAHPGPSGWPWQWRPAAPGWCAPPSDVREIKQLAPRMLAVVPGVRPAGTPDARPGAGGHAHRGHRRRRRHAGGGSGRDLAADREAAAAALAASIG